MKETFDYDDINLVPRLGILKSRSECDTTVKLGKHTFNLPIIPANMSSVINEEIAIKLAENNFFYIMHRFDINTIEFVEKMHNRNLIISISVGVTDYWYDIITKLKDIKITPDYITVDIAHGHSELAKNMILHIKNNLPNAFIIAGNVATKEGGLYLQSSGADAVKIGVGPGSVCTTAMNTGFGTRNIQASVIKDISSTLNIPVIADGNIKYPGDVNKSLVLGATMVMAGSMFSNLNDSPNKIITDRQNNKFVKYWGSASSEENKTNRIEGKSILKPLNDISYLEQMRFIKDGIESGISYAGGKDISAFNHVDIIINK